MPLSNHVPSSRQLRPGICTSTTRPPSPSVGQKIFETDTLSEYVWNGTEWKTFSGTVSVETLTADQVNSTAISAGHTLPSSNNTFDLGSTSLRWRNIYTQDLHLSNGIGDYTVVEGEENLYLINHNTGKSYKFALIEVDPSEVPPLSKD
jgi:hypothetical protein